MNTFSRFLNGISVFLTLPFSLAAFFWRKPFSPKKGKFEKMVNSGHVTLSVVRQYGLLKIARSSLYYERTDESAINLTLRQEIDRALTE